MQPQLSPIDTCSRVSGQLQQYSMSCIIFFSSARIKCFECNSVLLIVSLHGLNTQFFYLTLALAQPFQRIMHVLRERISACAESRIVLCISISPSRGGDVNECARARVCVMRVFMRFSFHCHTWRVWCRRHFPQHHRGSDGHYVCVTENCDVA